MSAMSLLKALFEEMYGFEDKMMNKACNCLIPVLPGIGTIPNPFYIACNGASMATTQILYILWGLINVALETLMRAHDAVTTSGGQDAQTHYAAMSTFKNFKGEWNDLVSHLYHICCISPINQLLLSTRRI